MIVSTSAIILSKVRYQDNDLIVKCLTRDLGVISYMVKNISTSKNSKNKFAFFQLLNILDLESNYNPNRSIQYIKDLKIRYNFTSLHTNIYKSSVVMFLSEILSNIIHNESKDLELFDFIEESFIWFLIASNSSLSCCYDARKSYSGNPNALCNLGLIYAEGSRLPESKSEAAHWFNLAYIQGSKRAAKLLDEYELWDYIEKYII